MLLNNYEKMNIDIKTYWDSNEEKIPKVATDMLSEIKDFLKSGEIKNCFISVGIDNSKEIQFEYQGSYNEETSNDYFRIIDKSDIDLICVLNKYTQNTLTIIENPEKNKSIEDWIGDISKDISENFEKFECISPNDRIGNYVEIFKFKILKDLIFEALTKKFPKYFFENRKKVIKIGLDKDFHSHNIELIFAGFLELHVSEIFPKRTPWKKLLEKEILKKTSNDHYVLRGYNIITSEEVPGRENYFKEIPNFSNINLLRLKERSKGSHFLKYVIFYKNFIKIWNEKKGNIFKIDISSFHIESLLYNMKWSFFPEPNPERIKFVNKELLDLLKTEKSYLNLVEINEIFSIKRNTDYLKLKEAVEKLNLACSLEWDQKI